MGGLVLAIRLQCVVHITRLLVRSEDTQPARSHDRGLRRQREAKPIPLLLAHGEHALGDRRRHVQDRVGAVRESQTAPSAIG